MKRRKDTLARGKPFRGLQLKSASCRGRYFSSGRRGCGYGKRSATQFQNSKGTTGCIERSVQQKDLDTHADRRSGDLIGQYHASPRLPTDAAMKWTEDAFSNRHIDSTRELK